MEDLSDNVGALVYFTVEYYVGGNSGLQLGSSYHTWSLEQEANSDPSTGRTRTFLTHSRCPVYVFTQNPVTTSHILIVLSREPGDDINVFVTKII
jgi:hypothetical protein